MARRYGAWGSGPSAPGAGRPVPGAPADRRGGFDIGVGVTVSLRQKRHSGMRLTPAGGRDRGLAADSDMERHAYTRCENHPITIR